VLIRLLLPVLVQLAWLQQSVDNTRVLRGNAKSYDTQSFFNYELVPFQSKIVTDSIFISIQQLRSQFSSPLSAHDSDYLNLSRSICPLTCHPLNLMPICSQPLQLPSATWQATRLLLAGSYQLSKAILIKRSSVFSPGFLQFLLSMSVLSAVLQSASSTPPSLFHQSVPQPSSVCNFLTLV
jgi:hypothetical protein